MKTIIYLNVVAFLMVMGCSKTDDFPVNASDNQLKSAKSATEFGTWDDTEVLWTSLWPVLEEYTAPPGYPEYDPDNYDLMAHFQYYSEEALSDAVIEFIFPNIIDFVPHMLFGRTYSVNNTNNITVISCTTDLVEGWNPMFCFMVKVDCNKGKSGYTTFWTDMKVNNVSVKGTIENKVFACN